MSAALAHQPGPPAHRAQHAAHLKQGIVIVVIVVVIVDVIVIVLVIVIVIVIVIFIFIVIIVFDVVAVVVVYLYSSDVYSEELTFLFACFLDGRKVEYSMLNQHTCV